jgi:DNA polymerase elongation subunit (family B)
MLFNCVKHRFVIKGESVVETGLWLRKKRYALKKVYDLETNQDKVVKSPESLTVKGLDIVRSSFPAAFKKFMSMLIMDILNHASRQSVDEKILAFKKELREMSYVEISRNTSVKDISTYERNSTVVGQFPKGAPIHVKAAISYNMLLKKWRLDTTNRPIRNGDKIKYVFLRKNPYKLDVIALKTYDDPDQILDFITEYIDYDEVFNAELAKKLQSFYSALGWGDIPTKTNQSFSEFFL